MLKNTKAITLISLVITIVVLIILASVAIYLNLGNNGIFIRAKEAREATNKQIATEKINLKITTAQMNKYAEKQVMPTLKELSEVLRYDDEIQYVTEESQVASAKYDVPSENPSSIFTKLNDYPYEFEINGSLQLASIDGVKVATGQDNERKMIGNSVGPNTIDSYNVKNFSMSASSQKNMLSGDSKFGTIDDEGNLVFNTSGLYYVSSSFLLSPKLNSQLYNRIFINDNQIVQSVTDSDYSAIPVSATFYANKGDKLKILINVFNADSKINSWYRIYL